MSMNASIRKSLFCLIIISSATMMAVFLLASRHRSLMDRSTLIARSGKLGFIYGWLDPDRCVVVSTDNWEEGRPDDWRGHAEIISMQAHTHHDLPGLSRALNHLDSTPSDISISPGRTWLYWVGRDTGDGWPHYTVSRLDGSGCHELSSDKYPGKLWLDDSRYVEEPRPEPAPVLLVHDPARPGHEKEYPLRGKSSLRSAMR
jgi:hypothetical protein